MKYIPQFRTLAIVMSLLCSSFTVAQSDFDECRNDWISKSDSDFASACAGMAFQADLEVRQELAWMFFARVNQLISDKNGVSHQKQVPQWMAWATDNDTFSYFPNFEFNEKNRSDLITVTSKEVLVGDVKRDESGEAFEEVFRNHTSYEYITKTAKLNTKLGVLGYIKSGNRVDMPVGTVELKSSWLKVHPGSAPEGALTFEFDSGTYWWRGMHIMAKMQSLPSDSNPFYTDDPSWFWTTFQFTDTPRLANVRNHLTTQNSPLPFKKVKTILQESGISGFGFEAYTPNGTQVGFTTGSEDKAPVILGHVDMESFAGSPNTAQPRYWKEFNSSCHSCHATASINPETETFFPVSNAIGALTPQYFSRTKGGFNRYLGAGFVPLDFMWPITFHAK